MMRIVVLALVVALGACEGKPPEFVEKKIAAPSRAETTPTQNLSALLNENWTRLPVWQEGTEERAEYEAERVIEGKIVKFIETRLTRKEAFSRQAYSATSDTSRTDLLAVVSQHVLARSDLAVYSASFSVLQRDPLKLAKFIASWSDERGARAKIFRRLVGRSMLYAHSWQIDGEGKGDDETDLAKNDMLYDQLPLTLRALNFKEGREFYWNALSELLEPASEKPVPMEWRFSIDALDTVVAPAGAFRCWRVSIKSAEREDAYWFSVDAPNVMVRARTPRYEAQLRRLDYVKRDVAILNKAKP
ncbi:MAG: hypothetical protein NZM06_01130 [Chloroherpetonaceae bacterium]|nr:hypothetical protein [Chloroherpetonaceae bacterium]